MAYYKKVAEYMKKHPDTIPTHHYFNMNRDEQMKHWWKLNKRLFEIDAKFFMLEAESKTHNWCVLFPGVNPILLHVGMFLSSI